MRIIMKAVVCLGSILNFGSSVDSVRHTYPPGEDLEGTVFGTAFLCKVHNISKSAAPAIPVLNH